MANDPSCIFCRISAGEAPASVVYEDERVVAFMDKHPRTPGHALVIPRRHTPTLSALDEDDGCRMFAVGRQIALALRDCGLRCEGVNLHLADGAAAGQTVFHAHLHVIPRFAGDGFRIAFAHQPAAQPLDEELPLHAARIRAALGRRDPKAKRR